MMLGRRIVKIRWFNGLCIGGFGNVWTADVDYFYRWMFYNFYNCYTVLDTSTNVQIARVRSNCTILSRIGRRRFQI